MSRDSRSMTTRGLRSRVLVVLFGVASVALVVQGCHAENSVVGGACAASYVECGGRCVDTLTNAEHCGVCDAPCSAGVRCGGGVCGGALDGSADGSSGSQDGGPNDGEGGNPDIDGGDACPPAPYVTAAACGACGIVCAAPNSACLRDAGGAFVCSPPCTPPLVACAGLCVDTQTDSENCGTCGKFCPSNICIGGMCQGSNPGDIVVLGHDYKNAASGSSQAKVLTNAVFIPRSNPLRVLSYEQYADPTAVARVKAIIQDGAIGRTIDFTPTLDAAALGSLTLAESYDVVIVYDQQAANAGTLATVGAGWSASLTSFAKSGGVVVALDGATGQGAMPVLLTNAGLLNMAGHQTMGAGTSVAIVAPADRVGTAVVSPYGSYVASASLQPNEPEGATVVYVARRLVNGTPADPVVVHKIVP